MIGYYNYTVILTYISLMSYASGMFFAMNNMYKMAIFCLAFSGLCDMFDGKIARRKKDRTEDEKRFGIQIDSLCDVVCFGAFPVMLCYRLGMDGWAGCIILMIYVMTSVIRLGFFNVMEEHRQDETSEARKYYQGLPITTISIVLPLLYVVRPFLKEYFNICLHAGMLAIGVLFVVNFKLKKPGNKTLAILVLIVALAVLKILHVF